MPELIPPRPLVSANAPAAAVSEGLVAAAHAQATARFAVKPAPGKTVFIDNYDSFTYNVVQVRYF